MTSADPDRDALVQPATPQDITARPVQEPPLPPVASHATDLLVARIEEHERLARRIPGTPVTGPRNQLMTVDEVGQEIHRITTVIALVEDRVDEKRGSLRHRLVPLWMKLLSLFMVIFVDYPIMFWMAGSIFNVDWSSPLGLPLLISAVVGVLATAGAAVALHHLGHEHREYKSDRGRLEWGALSPYSRATLLAVALLLLLIGWGSYQRIYSEGVLSGSDLAVLLALLVSFVLVLSGWLIWRTAFRDGSILTDDLRRYSRIARRFAAEQRAHEDSAAELRHQLVVVQRRAQRSSPHQEAP